MGDMVPTVLPLGGPPEALMGALGEAASGEPLAGALAEPAALPLPPPLAKGEGDAEGSAEGSAEALGERVNLPPLAVGWVGVTVGATVMLTDPVPVLDGGALTLPTSAAPAPAVAVPPMAMEPVADKLARTVPLLLPQAATLTVAAGALTVPLPLWLGACAVLVAPAPGEALPPPLPLEAVANRERDGAAPVLLRRAVALPLTEPLMLPLERDVGDDEASALTAGVTVAEGDEQAVARGVVEAMALPVPVALPQALLPPLLVPELQAVAPPPLELLLPLLLRLGAKGLELTSELALLLALPEGACEKEAAGGVLENCGEGVCVASSGERVAARAGDAVPMGEAVAPKALLPVGAAREGLLLAVAAPPPPPLLAVGASCVTLPRADSEGAGERVNDADREVLALRKGEGEAETERVDAGLEDGDAEAEWQCEEKALLWVVAVAKALITALREAQGEVLRVGSIPLKVGASGLTEAAPVNVAPTSGDGESRFAEGVAGGVALFARATLCDISGLPLALLLRAPLLVLSGLLLLLPLPPAAVPEGAPGDGVPAAENVDESNAERVGARAVALPCWYPAEVGVVQLEGCAVGEEDGEAPLGEGEAEAEGVEEREADAQALLLSEREGAPTVGEELPVTAAPVGVGGRVAAPTVGVARIEGRGEAEAPPLGDALPPQLELLVPPLLPLFSAEGRPLIEPSLLVLLRDENEGDKEVLVEAEGLPIPLPDAEAAVVREKYGEAEGNCALPLLLRVGGAMLPLAQPEGPVVALLHGEGVGATAVPVGCRAVGLKRAD